jgi:hypothetical protein
MAYRVRQGWSGKLILQVQKRCNAPGSARPNSQGWCDASLDDITPEMVAYLAKAGEALYRRTEFRAEDGPGAYMT